MARIFDAGIDFGIDDSTDRPIVRRRVPRKVLKADGSIARRDRLRGITVCVCWVFGRCKGNRHTGTCDCLPGNLLLVGVFTNDVFDEFYPLINVTRIDDNRSRYDVAERVHPDLLVEVKDLHRKIALEPETLAV